MNLSILFLPALLATLAASAVHTLPADLRHDAAGKTPLTVARMAVARGAGGACRQGCNEANSTCAPQFGPDPGTGDPGPVMGYSSQIWSPHNECGPGFSGCTNQGDVLCNTVYQYPASGCSGSPSVSRTYTSSCAMPVPVGPAPAE